MVPLSTVIPRSSELHIATNSSIKAAEGSILVGIVVDDCQVAASSAALIDEFVAMCNSELRGITVERGFFIPVDKLIEFD